MAQFIVLDIYCLSNIMPKVHLNLEKKGWRWSSEIEHLPSTHKAPGFTPNIAN
jgi:hypothetical protein